MYTKNTLMYILVALTNHNTYTLNEKFVINGEMGLKKKRL